MFIGPSVMGSGDLGALPEPLHVLPAALLLAAERFAFATPALDPLAHLPRVPHPSVWWRLQERLPEFLLLVFAEQCPIPGTRIAVTTIPERLRASLVVTAGELLNPAPRVSGDLHHLGCALALADEPEDLIVAAQDRVVGFAVTVLQLFWGQVRFKLYRLWHNDLLYRRTWYDIGVTEHPHRQREGQPHHVGVVAPDPLDERRRPALDRVPCGLAHALSQSHVRLQLLLAERPHAHRGDGVPDRQPTRARDGNPGVDLVGTAAQEQEHPAHLLAAPSLAQDASLSRDVHDRVRREDDAI